MPGVGASDRLIFALDVASAREALALADQLAGVVSFFKVGLELYTAAGMTVVEALVARGHRVFLDLKLFDVPETVKRAARSIAAHVPAPHPAAGGGIAFLTVHEGGATVAAAVEGLGSSGIGVLAVTVLTSMDQADVEALGCTRPVAELVLARARRARAAGACGVVASPQEAAALRAALDPASVIVTPGIRPASKAGENAAGDQKRLSTPAAAIASGADYLVVGRPIRNAPDPAAAARAILAEMQAVLTVR